MCEFFTFNFRYIERYIHVLKHKTMGKLNVSMLRYLSSEEFRVLTAVSGREVERIYRLAARVQCVCFETYAKIKHEVEENQQKFKLYS